VDRDHSQEGTLAHQVAAEALAARFGLPVPAWPDDLDRDAVDDYMRQSAECYAAAVAQAVPPDRHASGAAVECQLDATSFLPGLRGTADFMSWDDPSRTLTLIDYKFGRTPVDIRGNVQLRAYAVMAAVTLGKSPERILLGIYQPRVSGQLQTEVMTLDDLRQELRTIKAEAAAVMDADQDTPVMPGAWCRYARCAGNCPAVREATVAALRPDTVPGMPVDQLLDLYQLKGAVTAFFELVEERVRALGSGPRLQYTTRKGRESVTDKAKAVELLLLAGRDDLLSPPKASDLKKALGDYANDVITRGPDYRVLTVTRGDNDTRPENPFEGML
jgi:hypothetical protein